MVAVSRHTVALTRRRQRQTVRAMQVVLVGVLAWGLSTGAPKAIVNASLALVVTSLPAVVRRNYEFVLDPLLALWITAAVFFHTLGSAWFYGSIPWWDNLTHALSASLIAGSGYVFVRVVDIHHDEIQLPRRFLFVYILVVVMAFGVIWELFEHGLDFLGDETGLTMPLSQQGLDDTVTDLIYDTCGAVVVAVVGQAYLVDVSEQVWDWLYGESNPHD